jgi:hypothetical protein
VDEEGFCGLLQGLDGMRLPAQFHTYFGWEQLERNLTYETCKGQFP